MFVYLWCQNPVRNDGKHTKSSFGRILVTYRIYAVWGFGELQRVRSLFYTYV